MQLAELHFQIALLGDFQRVPYRLRHFTEQRLHLRGRAQIKLLRHIAHPLGIAEQALGADADERVMCMRVIFLEVMHVVGRDELQSEFLRPRNQVAIHFDLLWNRVVLEFEVKVLRAEDLFEPVHRGARPVQLVLLDQFGNFAGETAGERDQPLLVLRQDFLVDARFVVITLQVGRGVEFDQVSVAGLVLGQQDQVVVNILAAARRLLVQAACRRHIDLAADDRFDALIARGLIKIDRAVEHTMVGDRQGGKLQVARLVHQRVETAGAIEQRILGVQMEMDKIGM